MDSVNIRTAVILPKELVKEFARKRVHIPDMDLLFYVYREENTIRSTIENISSSVDAVIFAGQIPYERCKDLPVLQNKIVTCIMYDAVDMLRIMYEVRVMGIDYDSISFDTANIQAFYDIMEDVGLGEKIPQYVYEFEPRESLSELVTWHESLYRAGKTRYAITAASCCANQLREKGIPCSNVLPVSAVIGQTMKWVKDTYYKKINASNITTLILVKIMNAESSQRGYIETCLKNQADELRGTYVSTGDDEYLIISNKYYVSKSTNNFKEKLQVEALLQKIDNLRINIGIGCDKLVNRAMDNARFALEQSMRDNQTSSRFFNEKKELIGPLASPKSGNLKCRNESEEAKSLAEGTSASETTMGLILDAINKLDNKFTIKDLSDYVNINRKSIERIVRQLYMKNKLTIVGQEAKTVKGKPCRVYSMQDAM